MGLCIVGSVQTCSSASVTCLGCSAARRFGGSATRLTGALVSRRGAQRFCLATWLGDVRPGDSAARRRGGSTAWRLSATQPTGDLVLGGEFCSATKLLGDLQLGDPMARRRCNSAAWRLSAP